MDFFTVLAIIFLAYAAVTIFYYKVIQRVKGPYHERAAKKISDKLPPVPSEYAVKRVKAGGGAIGSINAGRRISTARHGQTGAGATRKAALKVGATSRRG